MSGSVAVKTIGHALVPAEGSGRLGPAQLVPTIDTRSATR